MSGARTAALALALALVALAGCGGEGESDSATATTSAAKAQATAKPAKANKTDAAFVNDMTPHHESAVDMAKLARTRAQHDELRQLAEDIIAAQNSEIATMRRIRRGLEHKSGTFGLPPEEMGMNHDLGKLRRTSRFDREFIDMMVPHHEGAILMAQLLLDDGALPELRTLANAIIKAQKAEIAQMKEWRKDWYGSAEPAAAIGGGFG